MCEYFLLLLSQREVFIGGAPAISFFCCKHILYTCSCTFNLFPLCVCVCVCVCVCLRVRIIYLHVNALFLGDGLWFGVYAVLE